MNRQHANLNIRYDFPIWDYRVPAILSKSEGWLEGTQFWFGTSEEEKHIQYSVEPAGMSLSGLMEDNKWNTWLQNLKELATEILGYKVGEIETEEVGHDFIWHNKDLAIFEKSRNFQFSKNPDLAWDIFEHKKEALTVLDELEIEKNLFKLKNHTVHDNIASKFQFRSHPSTARFLFEQVQAGKIPEFDYKPISRKCIWALADIGTKEAKEYLQKLAKSEDKIIQGFAQKRLDKWSEEIGRKGRMINDVPFPPRERIKLKRYLEVEQALPRTGNCLSAFQYDDSIIVYQAYKPSIVDYAVKNQQFGGNDFSFSRMTWVKPNFLWMMYRSGWAKKENQERILAIRIRKSGWEELLKAAVFSSFKEEFFESKTDWRNQLENSEVRLQWDPNHDPYGDKLERKAIQIGFKGELLKKFNSEMIVSITDITTFVKKQYLYVEHNQLQHLEIPNETIYQPIRKDLNIGITSYE